MDMRSSEELTMEYQLMRVNKKRFNPYMRNVAKNVLIELGIPSTDQSAYLELLVEGIKEQYSLSIEHSEFEQIIPLRLSYLAILALTNDEGYFDSFMDAALNISLVASVTLIPPEESDYYHGVINVKGMKIPFG
jgi:hypothetical protein